MGKPTKREAYTTAARLKVLYICALGAIAVLTIAAQLQVQQSLRDQEHRGSVINHAGRLRMLSQRVAKEALALGRGNQAERAQHAAAMQQASDDLSYYFTAIRDGSEELAIPPTTDPATLTSMHDLAVSVQRIADECSLLATRSVGTTGHADALTRLLAEESAFLPRMDSLVAALEKDNRERVAALQFTEWTLMGLVLALLLVEALLIFEPATRTIRAQFEKLLDNEEKLRQARDAAMLSNRTKTEFLANMSHEIRTPMTSILGYAESLQAEQLDAVQRRDAYQTIARNGEHLLAVLNDILDISRLEAGKMTIEQSLQNPLTILADVLSIMRIRANEKRLSLSTEFVGLLPERILTDPTRLRQILMNLIGNAIKFTDTGKIEVRVLYEANDPARLIFEVEDSGIGMTPEQQRRVFHPFDQGDSSMTRRFGGTGLGLSISHRLARRLGGSIEVSSEPGVGSLFRVRINPGPTENFRLVDPTGGQSPSKPVAPKPPPTLRGRVLLAEDGLDNQKFITRLLQQASCDVTWVENGREALRAALDAHESKHPYDLILMDMQMPVMDGYAATSKLRQAGYSGAIVALTAHAMAGDRERCLEAGCDDYTTKPISRGIFFELLTRYMATDSEAPARK